MASPKFDCVKQLLDNPSDIFLTASELLLKFANNVLNHPENPKYRSIRIGNDIVTNKLLPANGGLDCLFAMGFLEVRCIHTHARTHAHTHTHILIYFLKLKYWNLRNCNRSSAMGIAML